MSSIRNRILLIGILLASSSWFFWYFYIYDFRIRTPIISISLRAIIYILQFTGLFILVRLKLELEGIERSSKKHLKEVIKFCCVYGFFMFLIDLPLLLFSITSQIH
jgi:hypothetical protein